MVDEIRNDRQIPFVTKKGQEKIESLTVAIVGLSGTGSHIAQQLAYLGVKKFILIDSDVVSETNLNRLIGGNKKDIGVPKVDIAARLIHFIAEGIEIEKVKDTFICPESLDVLKKSDFIFGCVDKDGARLILTEFSKAFDKPFMDIATGIDPDTLNFGGRIVLSDKDIGCLLCRDELDQNEIQRDLSSPEDRSVDDRIYGVQKSKLGKTGPSVVSLNAILSSLAVTEFIIYVTGVVRKAIRHLDYRGNMGIVTKKDSSFVLPGDCYYCNCISGKGEKADLERYSRQGITKFLR